MSFSPAGPEHLSPQIQRYLQQMEKKRDYNRTYYKEKIKPRKEQEKLELDILRERCAALEVSSRTQQEYIELAERYNDLISQFQSLQRENEALQQGLDIARQKNYELMMQKADQLLPPLQTRPNVLRGTSE